MLASPRQHRCRDLHGPYPQRQLFASRVVAEERDYYPYWAPSPWKDLAIVTNVAERCAYYQQESQNVKARGYCVGGGGGALEPISQVSCAASGGTWHVVPAFGLPAPECVTAESAAAGLARTTVTVPSEVATNCALRLRYNMTPAEIGACSVPGSSRASCDAASGRGHLSPHA